MDWSVAPGFLAWVAVAVVAVRYLLRKLDDRRDRGEANWIVELAVEAGVALWGLVGLALLTLLFGWGVPG